MVLQVIVVIVSGATSDSGDCEWCYNVTMMCDGMLTGKCEW